MVFSLLRMYFLVGWLLWIEILTWSRYLNQQFPALLPTPTFNLPIKFFVDVSWICWMLNSFFSLDTELNDPWCELHSLKDLPEIGSFQIHIKWGLVEIEIPSAHPNNYLMSATDTLTKFVLEPGPQELRSSQVNKTLNCK